MPGPYDYLGYIFLRKLQLKMFEDPTMRMGDIYQEVKQAIYVKMGVDGSDLSPELDKKKKDILQVLAPYNAIRKTLYDAKRAVIPKDIDTMIEFNQELSWNYHGDENLCKYVGKLQF